METRSIPPEICARIASHSRQADLVTLARTTKSLQDAAERKLYSDLLMRDPTSAFRVCSALLTGGSRRGAYVHKFWFYVDPRRNRPAALPSQFWDCIQSSLCVMPNLEDLYIADPVLRNSWILSPAQIHFQLKDAKLRFLWGPHMVAFLQEQTKLRTLQARECFEDRPVYPISSSKLPALEVFDGHFRIAMELLDCKLTHLRALGDEETFHAAPSMIQELLLAPTPLRSLSIIYIPQQVSLEVLNLLTASPLCFQLHHFGVIHYPSTHRHTFLKYLTKFSRLRAIEVEVASWEPRLTNAYQRIIAMELHTYCPTLRHVIFWLTLEHTYLWSRDGDDWLHCPNPGRQESLWKEA